jgi:hypothetical protein
MEVVMQAALSKLRQFFGFSESELIHQIEEHKYVLSKTIPYELTLEESFDSWNQNVFVPLVNAIDEQGVDIEFPDLDKNELFIRISEHWYFLQDQRDADITAQEAVLSFASLFSEKRTNRFDRSVQRLYLLDQKSSISNQ